MAENDAFQKCRRNVGPVTTVTGTLEFRRSNERFKSYKLTRLILLRGGCRWQKMGLCERRERESRVPREGRPGPKVRGDVRVQSIGLTVQKLRPF
jgi:hypothetical protein